MTELKVGYARVSTVDQDLTAQQEALEAYIRALLAPALQRLGDTRVPGEAERTTALRASLFDALARFGNDKPRREQAAAHFAALGENPDAVDADLADAVVRVVASTANQDTWDELRRRAAAARTAQDTLRHQGALADAADSALVLRFWMDLPLAAIADAMGVRIGTVKSQISRGLDVVGAALREEVER